MIKTTTIPAGYRLTVESWENDGDNEITKIIEGIQNDDDVMFYVALCKMHEMNTPYSNLYEPKDHVIEAYNEAIQELIVRFPNMTYYDQPLVDHNSVSDITSLMGLGASEYYLSRVCDSFKIEYIKEDITFEDITDRFLE